MINLEEVGKSAIAIARGALIRAQERTDVSIFYERELATLHCVVSENMKYGKVLPICPVTGEEFVEWWVNFFEWYDGEEIA